MTFLAELPDWLEALVYSLTMLANLGLAGFILVRAGLSPYWALLLLPVPFLQVAALWLFAYARWPRYQPRPGDQVPAPHPGSTWSRGL